MDLIEAFAIYFVAWWISLFLVLPFAARAQAEPKETVPGTDPGAPARPRLLLMLAANTLLASLIFAGIYLVMEKQLIRLDDIPFLPGRDWPAG